MLNGIQSFDKEGGVYEPYFCAASWFCFVFIEVVATRSKMLERLRSVTSDEGQDEEGTELRQRK